MRRHARADAGRLIDLSAAGKALGAAQAEAETFAVVAGLVPFAIVVDDAEQLDDVTIQLLKGIVGNRVCCTDR